jgi:putative oxidoreductase
MGTMIMTTEIRHRAIIRPLGIVYDAIAPFSYALLRFVAGAFLVPHGYPKLFQGGAVAIAPLIAKLGFHPSLGWAYAVGCVEVFGGILIAIGFLTRIAAAAAMIELLVIVILVKSANGFFARNNGFEFELIWALLCLMIFFKGGGRYSVDRAIGKEI